MKENGRFQALETTLSGIQMRYGEGAIMRLGQASHQAVETIPSYKEDRLAQGRESAKQALREKPDLCRELENAIRRQIGVAELDTASALVFDAEEAAGEQEIKAGDLALR